MAPQGSAPFSSIFYLTKRKKLSEKLFEHKSETSDPEYHYNYENVYYPSYHSEGYKNVGIHKNLIHLSQDRLKFETSDGTELDVDDGLNRGLNCLSQLSNVINLNDVDDLSRGYLRKQQYDENFTGKMDDIASLIEFKGFKKNEGAEYKSLERDLELSNSYVGPLNLSEVGNLLVLALKLQESEKLDLDLEKRLEISAQLWKNNRVPNTVSTFLISSLYKNKPHQCETCGLRFALIDTKGRHELTHKTKSHGFWHTLEGWIHISSKSAFGSTYTRTLITFDTFRRLLRDIPTYEENVVWLRQMLFSNDQSLDNADMDEDVQEMKDDQDDSLATCSENLWDEKTLWSWGIKGLCDEVPHSASTNVVESQDYDNSVFTEIFKNLRLNLFIINLQKPVTGSFGDMSRSFCSICRDALRCEFDVKYSKFVYTETTAFQLDFKLMSKMFHEPVTLSYLISTDDLDKLSAMALLKKISAIKLVSSDIKSKMELAINDWSFKYIRELLDIDSSLPKTDNVKYLDKLFKSWRNPFKVNDGFSQSLLYSHTCCLKVLFNSHLRLAKSKLASDGNDELLKMLNGLTLA